MICRLCLIETKFGFSLKNAVNQENDEETEDIAAIIRKHIDVHLYINSNFVCNVCWGQISEFHSYYLFIEEKQKERSKVIISTGNDAMPIATKLSMVLEDEVADKDGYGIGIRNECLMGLSTPMVAEKGLNQWGKEATPQEANESPDINEFSDATEHLEETQNFQLIDEGDIEPASCDTNTNDFAETTRTQQAKIIPTEEKKKVLDKKTRREKSNLIIAKHAGILKCELCAQTLKTFGNLRQHFKKEHDRTGYITCCNKRYYLQYTYAEHLEWHANSNLWKCEPCNLVYSCRDSYDSHLLQVHPEGESSKLKCTLCPARFSKGYLQRRHERKLHSEKPKCDECNKEFTNVNVLRHHKRTVHLRAYQTECDICGKIFSNSTNCKIHKAQIHQGAGILNFQCPHCPQKFASSKLLNKHKNECYNEQKSKCNECGKEFKDSNRLKEHTRKVHLRAYSTECDICGKTISKRSLLNSHKSKVHGMEELSKFQCPLCPKKFTHKFLLNAHTKDSHSKQTPKCDECGKEFKSWDCLKQHTRGVHLRVYEIECDICGNSFASSATLNLHKARVHAAEEDLNFQCLRCPRKFAHMSLLKQHERVCRVQV